MTRPRRSRWLRLTASAACLIVCGLLAFGGLKYLRWRNQLIEWDYESIDRFFGGEAEEDRFQKIEVIKEWEYRALKRTRGGKDVWLHVKLSKRHCGNWMLVDPNQRDLLRPLELRWPNGLPHRPGAVSCLGIPLN